MLEEEGQDACSEQGDQNPAKEHHTRPKQSLLDLFLTQKEPGPDNGQDGTTDPGISF